MVPRCDLCLTVSGTATLHVAGWGVPMIVVYRGNPLLWHLVGRWVVKTRTYSLVNLLADARSHIVPEFMPWYGSNAPVADYAIDMLRNPSKLERQRAQLRHLVRTLDRPGASMNVAKLAMDMLVSGKKTAVVS
jgi:lipid-A-disaccharide synthase